MPDVKPVATAETRNNQTFAGIPIAPATLLNTAAINQRQLLRLQVAAQILTGLVTGQDILYTHDPDTCGSHKEVVDTALKYADLLLKAVIESAD